MQDLYSGLFLMLVGMGTVFLFLVLLILATEAVRKMVDAPAPAAPATPTAPAKPASPSGADDATLAVVIASAVTQFRQDRKGR